MSDLNQNLTTVFLVLRNALPYLGIADNLFEPLDPADGCHARNRLTPAHPSNRLVADDVGGRLETAFCPSKALPAITRTLHNYLLYSSPKPYLSSLSNIVFAYKYIINDRLFEIRGCLILL